GGFMATWVIAYGLVQGIAPRLTGRGVAQAIPDGRSALLWASVLVVVTALVALATQWQWQPELSIIGGLLLFGAVFAINSSLHSFLIVHYAGADGVSLDVGFYYMANAMGRLLGTILSGFLFQWAGFAACLWVSVLFLAITTLISLALPHQARMIT
ncbi:MAG: MFS transporter, partial [Ferrimonas sp.]